VNKKTLFLLKEAK